jgi:type II secretory pathway component PulL
MIMVDPRVSEFDEYDEEEFPVEALVVDAPMDELAVGAPLVDALVVDAPVVDALAIDPLTVEAPVVEALVVDVEPVRHLTVAPDSVKRRRHVRIAATAAVVSISATLFAVVGFNVELAQHQIQLQKLQTHLQAEQTRYYDLRAQVAQSSSPSVISSEASHLGLVPTSPIYLRAPIPKAPADPTGSLTLPEPRTGSSLGNVQ